MTINPATLLNCPYYQRADHFRVYFHLLAHADDVGDVVISVRAIARELLISYKRVRLIIDELLRDGAVEQRAQKKAQLKTRLIICDLARYAADNEQKGRKKGPKINERAQIGAQLLEGVSDTISSDYSDNDTEKGRKMGRNFKKKKKKEKENSPHTPYKEKEINKEKEAHQRACACVREAAGSSPRAQLEADISNPDTAEELQRVLHIDATTLRTIATDILDYWALTRETDWSLRHFVNAARITINRQRNGTTQLKGEAGRQQRATELVDFINAKLGRNR